MELAVLHLEDGRSLEFCRSGPEDAETTLVFHVGTPSAAVSFPHVTAAAAARGVRTVSYSRAGYGGSPRTAGRTVGDEAANTAALADHLGAASFLVAGWSGGGPAALACAALLPERVRSCVVLAGASPPEEVGPEWFEWSAEEDRAELRGIAAGSPDAFRPAFEEAAAPLATTTPDGVVAWPEFTDADRAAFDRSPGLADAIADSMRRGVGPGVDGWLDDEAAEVRPWGFHVGDIRVPVTIRHGELDQLVRVDHGRWLAMHIPGAKAEIRTADGHISIAASFDEVMDDLLAAAG
jgi:pimeloyl-ACP methyl ester carboxylesterase